MSTPGTASRPATRADLDALPEHVVGEIIDGVLHTFPRPRPQHAYVAIGLGGDLDAAFQRARRPGRVVDSDRARDRAARRHRGRSRPGGMARRAASGAADRHADSIRAVPDWVCEILSPSTRAHDQLVKRRLYARAGVPYLWFIDLEARTLSLSKLAEALWVELAVHGPDERIRAQPFDEVELSMASWWPPGSPG